MLIAIYISVSSRKFSKTDIPSTFAQLQAKNKTQTLSFKLTPKVPSCWPHHQVILLSAVRAQSLAQEEHSLPTQVLHVPHY